MIFLTEAKCKIRFIYVGFNCKRKKWGKKCLEIMTIKGGGGVWRLMEKTILNFHFDYLHPSLIITLFSENSTTFSTGFNHCNFSFPSRSRSFPRMEASDSLPEFREWIFFIPFPFPNFGNCFFLIPFPFPNFGNGFFSIPFPFPNFGNGINYPFPFPNSQKSFPLTPD